MSMASFRGDAGPPPQTQGKSRLLISSDTETAAPNPSDPCPLLMEAMIGSKASNPRRDDGPLAREEALKVVEFASANIASWYDSMAREPAMIEAVSPASK